MLRHFVPSRELHPLAPLKRLSLVDLPSANGFDKPSAASKLESKQIGSFKGEILWDYLVKAKKNEKKNT